MTKKVEWVRDPGRSWIWIENGQVVFSLYGWNPAAIEPIVTVREDAVETTNNKYYALGRKSVEFFNYLYEQYNKCMAELVANEYGGR